MRFRIGAHALTRAEERGANETDIRDVLSTSFSIPARYGKISVEDKVSGTRFRLHER